MHNKFTCLSVATSSHRGCFSGSGLSCWLSSNCRHFATTRHVGWLVATVGDRVEEESTRAGQTIHSCIWRTRVGAVEVEATIRVWVATWFGATRTRQVHQSCNHYDDVIMGAMASQITSVTIVYSTVYSDADQRKHQSSASLAFVRGIHRGPVNSPHKWPVTQKMSSFDDVIMQRRELGNISILPANAQRNKHVVITSFWRNNYMFISFGVGRAVVN